MICRISFLEWREVLRDVLPTRIIHQATTIEFVILAAYEAAIKYRTWLSQMPIFLVVQLWSIITKPNKFEEHL